MDGAGVVLRLQQSGDQLQFHDALGDSIGFEPDEISQPGGKSVGGPPAALLAFPPHFFQRDRCLLVGVVEAEQSVEVGLADGVASALHVADLGSCAVQFTRSVISS